MTTHVEATFANGVLTPDQPLPLADQTRVRLTIEPIEEWSPEQTRVKLTIEPLAEKPETPGGWEAFRAWIRQNSVHGLGRRLTRDELHERR